MENKGNFYKGIAGVARFSYGKDAGVAFSKRRKQIARLDGQLCFALSAFLFVFGLALCLFSLLFETLEAKRWLYLILSGLSLLSMIVCAALPMRLGRLTLLCHYLYMLFTFSALLVFSLLKGCTVTMLYCALSLIFPTFLMDKPLRAHAFFALIALAFCICRALQAGAADIESECLSCAGAFFAGCFITRCLNSFRLEDMARRTRIERQRDTDGLTHLYTRRAAIRDIDGFLSTVGLRCSCAMLLLDVDNFKSVNDTLGHAAGDALLVEISEKLRSMLRRSDYVSRMGGDEFVIFLADVPSREWLRAKVEAINGALCITAEEGGESVAVSASIGVAFTDRRTRNYETLYHHADAAMYAAKQAGGNRFTIYSYRWEPVKSMLERGKGRENDE